MSALFISCTVNCVWLCHVTLLLRLWLHCAYLYTCRGAACGGMCVSARENHIFGFTPFHTVIEISAVALIIHPEDTEGVNQCPVWKPNRSKGRSVVVQCLPRYIISRQGWALSSYQTHQITLREMPLKIHFTVFVRMEHLRKQCTNNYKASVKLWLTLSWIRMIWMIRCPLKCLNFLQPSLKVRMRKLNNLPPSVESSFSIGLLRENAQELSN